MRVTGGKVFGTISMRIVFIGAVDFSYFCLARVLEQGGNVVAVFSPALGAPGQR